MQETEIQEQIWQSFINPSTDVDTNWQGVVQTNRDVSLRISYVNVGRKKLKYLKCEKNTPHLVGYRELVHLMNMCFNFSKTKKTYKQYIEEVSRKKGHEALVVTIVPISSERETKGKTTFTDTSSDKIL
jgi:hypothetical protein